MINIDGFQVEVDKMWEIARFPMWWNSWRKWKLTPNRLAGQWTHPALRRKQVARQQAFLHCAV